MAKPHFWHEVAVIWGGPVSMALFSLGIARLVEQEEGPVLPPLHAPDVSHKTRLETEGEILPKARVKDLSNSTSKREKQGSSGVDEHVDENESSNTMHLIFAFS